MIELLVVLSVIAIIAAISVPLVLRAKLAAHEASAISSLGRFTTRREIFRATCGYGKFFAATLPQLGAAHTITQDLADAPIVAKSGYLITIVGTPPTSDKDKDKLDACRRATGRSLVRVRRAAAARDHGAARVCDGAGRESLGGRHWLAPVEPLQAERERVAPRDRQVN